LKVIAMAIVVVDTVLLSGFMVAFFRSRNLSLARRTRMLRWVVGCAAISGILIFLFGNAQLLLPPLLISNVLAIGITAIFFCLKPRQIERHSNVEWLQAYVQKLESELADRAIIERDLSFIAGVAERDPNCVIEVDTEGRMGYRNPATGQIFPDLMEKGAAHPVMAGLQDAIGILKRDGKVSIRRPFRYGDRQFEQQITWSAATGKLCLYMSDVTAWKLLDQQKNDLLNIASHEFRVPLSSILASARVIETGMAGPVTEDQRSMLELMGNSVNRLSRMLSDFLDLSKMEAGKVRIHRQDVELAALVDSVALTFAAVAKAQGLAMTTSVSARPMMCMADPDKIVQVLTNLISNALKFTREGRITLTAEVVGSDVRLAVQDTGIGIPTNKLDKVFGKFQQFSAAVHGEKGSGLGLSLSKMLVEMHGGKISVDSAEGRGTVFSFTLPIISKLMAFHQDLQRLYEEVSVAGGCLSAFILQLEEPLGRQPFEGKAALVGALETLVRKKLNGDGDTMYHEGTHLYFILQSVNKVDAKSVVEDLVAQFLPIAAQAGAVDHLVLRVQHTSLPDDGTLLEGLQEKLAA
jgi:signal transduction histidine kinase